MRRGRARFGGRNGQDPEAGRLILWAVGGLLLFWIVWTSTHRIDKQERGVVTRLGSYAETLEPGMRFTFPAPIDVVNKINVEEIRQKDIPGTGNTQNLVLTGDQNMIDLMCADRGITGRILKPYYRNLLTSALGEQAAHRLIVHVTCLFAEHEEVALQAAQALKHERTGERHETASTP